MGGEVFAVEQGATHAVAVSLVQQHRDGAARSQPPGIQPYASACPDLLLNDAVWYRDAAVCRNWLRVAAFDSGSDASGLDVEAGLPVGVD